MPVARASAANNACTGPSPTAASLIDADGVTVSEAAVGDGPVHALFAALARATGLALEIESYQVSSVTTGDDAQGQAQVIARVDGAELTGSGTSTDILEASAQAWLDIANRLQRTRAQAADTRAAAIA